MEAIPPEYISFSLVGHMLAMNSDNVGVPKAASRLGTTSVEVFATVATCLGLSLGTITRFCFRHVHLLNSQSAHPNADRRDALFPWNSSPRRFSALDLIVSVIRHPEAGPTPDFCSHGKSARTDMNDKICHYILHPNAT
jgi:hypothetical protein